MPTVTVTAPVHTPTPTCPACRHPSAKLARYGGVCHRCHRRRRWQRSAVTPQVAR